MPPTVVRQPVVRIGVKAGSLPVQTGKADGITKVVHHENLESGGYVIGHSVATHQPGSACPKHNHRSADELFQVLDGFGVITVNGQEYYVQTGDSVYVPARTQHQVAAAPANDGEGRISRKPFVVLCILVTAPGHEGDRQPWLPTSA